MTYVEEVSENILQDQVSENIDQVQWLSELFIYCGRFEKKSTLGLTAWTFLLQNCFTIPDFGWYSGWLDWWLFDFGKIYIDLGPVFV